MKYYAKQYKNMMQKDKMMQYDWFNNIIRTRIKMSLDFQPQMK